MQSKSQQDKNPKELRILQIVIGIISTIISGLIISDLDLIEEFIVSLLAIILIIVGIERIGFGVLAKISNKLLKILNITFGGLAIILSIITLVYPNIATSFVLALLAGSLMIIGISKIISGIKDKSKWKKILLIAVGVLSISVGMMVIATPVVGIKLIALILSVCLLLNGIQNIVMGFSGNISTKIV
jgi:uncharacterized membrane protein HdeD (DUF308 family)